MSVLVHRATLVLAEGGDARAPGGAVTVQLCGDWVHDNPCRWPHHTSVSTDGDRVDVRCVAVVADPAETERVRDLVVRGLALGVLDGPEGRSTWTVVEEGPDDLREDERELAERLASGPDAD